MHTTTAWLMIEWMRDKKRNRKETREREWEKNSCFPLLETVCLVRWTFVYVIIALFFFSFAHKYTFISSHPLEAHKWRRVMDDGRHHQKREEKNCVHFTFFLLPVDWCTRGTNDDDNHHFFVDDTFLIIIKIFFLLSWIWSIH
jgi:hypothetical protein